MEQYIVSARKYRPSTFDTVVGQKALTSTLKSAIATGRLAHAYLFCGPRGVGKTSCARIFAKTINCQHPSPDGNPCNECDSCRSFNENRSLNILELDAASNNGVDDIRTLIEQVQVPPTSGRYRVFIIDEVHMLTPSAFNAFLKTLEEPPSYAIFVLATTEKHKIIPTILSRCQIYDFNRITIADIVDQLSFVASQEGIEAESGALKVIATKADGAMRDALSIFDQVAASSGGKITYQSTIDNLNMLDSAIYTRLVNAFLKQDVPQALLIYQEVRDKGFDSHFFINGLADYLRNLMVAQNPATQSLLDEDADTISAMHQLASGCSPQFFYQAMSLCNSADLNYRAATNKTFLVELLLIRLCQLLCPSPNYSGVGEGRLQPIATNGESQPTASTSASAPASKPSPAPADAPSRPQQPKAAATPPPPPPAAKAPVRSAPSSGGGRPGAHVPRLSLRGLTDTKAKESPAMAAEQHRDQPFTLQDVLDAWQCYMDNHPSEHILINTMRRATPAATDTPGEYNVTVQNPMQVDEINNHVHDITIFCRDKVNNDTVKFNVFINEDEESPYAWTDRQIYEHWLKNEKFSDFAKKLNLSLI